MSGFPFHPALHLCPAAVTKWPANYWRLVPAYTIWPEHQAITFYGRDVGRLSTKDTIDDYSRWLFHEQLRGMSGGFVYIDYDHDAVPSTGSYLVEEWRKNIAFLVRRKP